MPECVCVWYFKTKILFKLPENFISKQIYNITFERANSQTTDHLKLIKIPNIF